MKNFLISFFSIFLLTAASNNCNDIECHKSRIEKYKQELNQAFQDLVKVDTNNIVIDSFKDSQVLWNKFIKEDCKFMNAPMYMTQGNGYIVVYYECLEEYYALRIKQINKMINDLKL